MNDVLARIHNVDYRAIGRRFRSRGSIHPAPDRALDPAYDLAQTDAMESMENLKKWLPGHIPDGRRDAHQPWRLPARHSIVHPTEPRVVAVLDWELTTPGHPLADLGYNCMIYHFGVGFGASSGYAALDLKAFGIPASRKTIAPYANRTGRDGIPDWEFYFAFSPFRLAGIVQGVYKRGLDGNASSESINNMATALACWPISRGR